MIPFFQIASEIRSEVIGHDLPISNVAEPVKALENEVIFLIQKQSLRFKDEIRSKAWIISKSLINADLEVFLSRSQINYLVTENMYEAFVKVIKLFYPERQTAPSMHSTAIIDKSAICSTGLQLGPYCFIGANSIIGSRVAIMAHSYIGNNVSIGEDTLIYPNVTIYDNTVIGSNVIIHAGTVVGSDGFGYYKKDTGHIKIPHVGKVVIGNNVEIGANCTIDRGTIGETCIMHGTKLDNLVQIAHNVVIGENTLIAAQTGIAGSTTIGDNVTIAGQVGIVGHITIGNNVTIGAQSGIISSIEEGKTVSGYPARDHFESLRKEAYIKRIPDILRILKQKIDE